MMDGWMDGLVRTGRRDYARVWEKISSAVKV